MTLTTAFVTGGGALLPKGAGRFEFTASSNAVKALADKPAKVKPLLERYGEAFEQSREAGRSVSFSVKVDPDGSATATPVAETVSEGDAFAVEKGAGRSPVLEKALAAAWERGRVRAAEILAGEDMLSAEAFAELLGTTRVTVNTKRQNGQVLGLDGARRGFRFPVWQINDEGKPYPELPSLQKRLGGPWAVYRFLMQPHGMLDGLTGREALEGGKGGAVLAAAESIARGDFG